MTSSAPRLLELTGVSLSIAAARRTPEATVLRDVSFAAERGEVVAIVGESGSGKSMTARSIMRLLPNGSRLGGDIRFDGTRLLGQSPRELAAFRASKVGMIYQDPRAHINPLWTVGDFLTEGLRTMAGSSRSDAKAKALGLLNDVGIPDGERRFGQYPHQLSGGLLQRIMIVSALMSDPELIIADEATTALDVTVQAEVMKVFRRLKDARGLTMLFITHDLDLAASMADSIVVMYAGRVIERGAARSIYLSPSHPYTSALLRSRPNPHSRERLESIAGRPASAAESAEGCAFAPRCRFATEVCTTDVPHMRKVAGSDVACHHAERIHAELEGALR